MKLKTIYLFIFLILLSLNLSAHQGGHGQAARIWMINNIPIEAEFVKYEKEKVYLMNSQHEVNAYDISVFQKKEQEQILEVHQKLIALNQIEYDDNQRYYMSGLNLLWCFFAGFLVFFSLFFYFTKKRKFHLSYGILGLAMITLVACKKDDDNDTLVPTNPTVVPANDVSFLTSIFGNFSGVTTNSDSEWFYISSNGIPEHNMMVGITNWQQQVPIDQDYTGTNSWAIPLQPELSDNPLSTQTNLLKGAIAIAVNGIPIFNPLNNRGEDANAIGELDQWGGHCGRADDYHYHLPPSHLQPIVGTSNPIAYALDGFPVYGETTEELDEYLGKFNSDGSYQYHTVQDYPYFIAGMRGEVTLDPNTTAPENQVIPQARTQGVRRALEPLRDASITNFVLNSDSSYSLTYAVNSDVYTINYSWDANRLYTYEFVDPSGSSTFETYQR